MARGLLGKYVATPLVAVEVVIWVIIAPALIHNQQIEVSGDNAYEHVEFLANIAPRLAGTEAEAIAASYIENEFRSYGLDVWIENFVIEKSYVVEDNRLRVTSKNSMSYNVMALLPGQSDEIMVIGAHHDSVLTPGAVDDASGVSIVLEIARMLSTEELSRTILFVTFGSEELDLLGSEAFVREHAENNIVVAIVFDSIAPGPENGLRIGLRDSQEVATTEWLDAYAQELAEDLGFYVKSEQFSAVKGYSDYASFTRAGIPGTWIYWVNPQHGNILWPIHTLADNLDAVDKVRLGQVASFGIELVQELAGVDLEAQRRAYELSPLLSAAFAVMSAGAVVLSIAAGSFMRYRRGWSWSRAARVFSFVTAAVVVAAYIWLLA